MKPEPTRDKILQRIQDGCYTPESVLLDLPALHLTEEDVTAYFHWLVAENLAEWRNQGGKTDMGRGATITLCMPKGMPDGRIDRLKMR